MRTILFLALLLTAGVLWAADAPAVYYYGFSGEPIELQRLDDGLTPWPVVSYGATPMPLTGRIGFKRDGADRIEFIELRPGNDPFTEARRLAGEPGIAWAQPEWLVRIVPHAVPNDPYFAKEWHLPQIDAATAWDTVEGSRHTVVAAVDSGVDRAHPDLAANIYGGIDLTGGMNAACDRPASGQEAVVTAAHGTMVSGLIAALSNNGIGVAGVCPGCAVLPVKFLRYDEESIPVTRIYDAIVKAADAGADVINNSWGDIDTDSSGNCIAVPRDSYRAEAIAYAKKHGRNGRGALVIWSAGNSECDTDLNENLKSDDIIVVSSLNQSGAKAWYTNTGAQVDLCAGAGSWTTDVTGAAGLNSQLYTTPVGDTNYTDQFSGTSASAAVISGVAALMYAANPLLNFTEAMRCIRQSAVKPATTTCAAGGFTVPTDDPYAPAGKERSPCFGYGIPDAAALVAMARDGSCGVAYNGCDTDAACGSGFYCDETARECIKYPPSKQKEGGCSLTLID